MARLSTLSFIVYKAASSNSVPTTSQVSALITHFYKLCYAAIYGVGHYSTDESTDTDTIIDSTEFRALLDAELSAITNAWHLSAKEVPGMIPQMTLSKEFRKALAGLCREKRGQFANIRLWGADTDDLWTVPR
jgi:hypothetical protein